MAERGRLLSGYRGKTRSGVRIPPSPLKNGADLIFRGCALWEYRFVRFTARVFHIFVICQSQNTDRILKPPNVVLGDFNIIYQTINGQIKEA